MVVFFIESQVRRNPAWEEGLMKPCEPKYHTRKGHQQKLPPILRHIRCRDSVLGNLGKKQCDVAARVNCWALSAHHGLLQQTVHVKESGIFIPCFISFLTCRELVRGIIFELSRPNTNHQRPLFYFNREETLLRAFDEASLWKSRKLWEHIRNEQLKFNLYKHYTAKGKSWKQTLGVDLCVHRSACCVEYVWSPGVKVFPCTPPLCRNSLSLSLELSNSARLPGEQVPGTVLSHCPQLSQVPSAMPGFLQRCLRFFFQQSHLPSPKLKFNDRRIAK